MKKAIALLSVYIAYMNEYRAEILLWALSGSLPIILMGVWLEAAQGGRFILTPIEFARYFLAVFIIRQLTVVWVIFEFEKEVVEGKLSPQLLQPIDPVWRHVASHVAERVTRIPFTLGLIGLFFLLYPQSFWWPSLINFLLFLLVAILTFALRFLIQYTFALLAFWTERAGALEELWFLLYLFLSGLIAPLQVFPPAVRAVIEWTPFPYLIYFPASLLIGLPVDIGRSFAVIAIWSIGFFILNRYLWRQGLKQYSGMGA
jgi:ABC-2 type transport system permease protein